MLARKISDTVMHDLEGRKGLLDDVDAEVREEIRDELAVKIEALLTQEFSAGSYEEQKARRAAEEE